MPDPVSSLDVVEPDPVDDTPSSFWLLAVTAGGVLAIVGFSYLVGALLIGVTA